MIKKIQTLILLGLCTFITPTVFASDGVIEINQTCAAQLGCFSSDFAGFPITIDGTAGSSYRLTSNLNINSLTINVIEINASNINLDLNGFSINCIASGCNSSGTNSGIKGGLGSKNIHIENGYIGGMGRNGIDLGESARLNGLNVYSNRDSGIRVGFNSIIKNCIVKNNSGEGIVGTLSFFGGAIATGILVSESVIYNNINSGIKVGNTSSILSNIVRDNGGNGIEAGVGSNIKGNTVQNNTLFGLKLDATAIYLQNVMVGNTGGSVSSGFNMGQNYCNTGICP